MEQLNDGVDQTQTTGVEETAVDTSAGMADAAFVGNDVADTSEVVETGADASVATPVIDTVAAPAVVVEEPVVEETAPPAEQVVVPAGATPLQPLAPVVKEEPVVEAKYSTTIVMAFHAIKDYVKAMAPNVPMDAIEGSRNQGMLYRAIINILNAAPGDFAAGYQELLMLVNANANGVFADTHIFRFMDQVQLPENDRKAFQRILNLIKVTADPATRKLMLEQVDMTKTLEFGVTEQGRQNIMNFYSA